MIKPNPGRNIKRQTEQAASLFLLDYLYGSVIHTELYNDEFGKPHIGNRKITVSFSHSRNMVACMIDTEGNPAGIDIEYRRDNISVLAQKFASETDISSDRGGRDLQLIWGCKEVLYKVYGKKGLDFKRDISISFDTGLHGRILKNQTTISCDLDFIRLDSFILVWNV